MTAVISRLRGIRTGMRQPGMLPGQEPSSCSCRRGWLPFCVSPQALRWLGAGPGSGRGLAFSTFARLVDRAVAVVDHRRHLGPSEGARQRRVKTSCARHPNHARDLGARPSHPVRLAFVSILPYE